VRATYAAPTNTLAPTTAEAEIAASTRGVGMWGDRSVVLASELRAVKKTSKRVALWAAVGSALVASGFTFWAAHAPVPGLAPMPVSAPAVTGAAAAAHEAALTNLEPTPNTVAPAPSIVPSALPVASAPTIPTALPKPAPVVAQVRAVKRAKPSAPSTDVAAPASTEFNPYADDNPSEAKPSESKPVEPKPSAPTASQLNAAMATAVQAPTAPAATAQPATPSPPPTSASSPGF
jgi:hypothetical protein